MADDYYGAKEATTEDDRDKNKSRNHEASLSFNVTESENKALIQVARSLNVSLNYLINNVITDECVLNLDCYYKTARSVKTDLEKIMSKSRSNFSQIEILASNLELEMSDDIRNKILKIISHLSIVYKSLKGSIIEKDEVYRSAMTIEVFKESLEVLEKEASVSHNASVRKNFRVDRHAYNNFKEQKNKKYGKRSKVNPYLCERLRELRLLRTEYKEDKSFHSELSNCLAILNELTTNENFEMLVASNSKRFTEPAFINIYNTLVKIYKIIKYRKEINDSTST